MLDTERIVMNRFTMPPGQRGRYVSEEDRQHMSYDMPSRAGQRTIAPRHFGYDTN